jgi:acetylornithine deacetylase/succinyl-diaminopimelate desuccinylase-like protein
LLEITKTKPGIATYCTDLATILNYKYIPFAIFGPGKIELAHQPNEYVELIDYYKSIELLYKFSSEM